MCFVTKEDTQRQINDAIYMGNQKRSKKFNGRRNGGHGSLDRRTYAYDCDFCDFWHITSIPKKIQRRIERKRRNRGK